MKPSFFKRLRRFFQTTLIGGVAAFLPITLLFLFFRWLVNLVFNNLEPIVELLPLRGKLQEILATIAIVIGILIAFFFAGLVVRSRIGRFINHVFEKRYLMRIPGYKVARETVMQFFGSNRSFFREVVLVDIFNSGTLMTGFITDTHGEYYTVFVPTGPNPTSGNIYHVHQDKLIRTNTAVDTGMKTIISCGAGSNEIFSDRIEKELNSPS
jgi:uncharacterized membrane protein